MPYKDPEKKREYERQVYQIHKEKKQETAKKYIRSQAGIKMRTMRNWRNLGVNNVNDELYNYYRNVTNCEVCGNDFKNSRDKHLDHDHETGDFRWVLCHDCNCNDNWKKYFS